MIYYDLRAKTPDSVAIRKKVFQKQIGIVLWHKRSKPGGIHYEIGVCYGHKKPFQQDYVSPEFPKVPIPDLMEWLDREAYPEYDKLRFDLLKWIISEETLKGCDLRELPGNYLHNILTLVFLTSNEFITTNEADLILLTIKQVEKKSIPEDIFKSLIREPSACRSCSTCSTT